MKDTTEFKKLKANVNVCYEVIDDYNRDGTGEAELFLKITDKKCEICWGGLPLFSSDGIDNPAELTTSNVKRIVVQRLIDVVSKLTSSMSAISSIPVAMDD